MAGGYRLVAGGRWLVRR